MFVPVGFTSGGAIASTALFSGATLASLGLTAGSYVFRSANDTITVNIGAVPEPMSWALMIAGFAAIGYTLRRRTVGGVVAAHA